MLSSERLQEIRKELTGFQNILRRFYYKRPNRSFEEVLGDE
jgi:hypothetical protein